MPCRSSSTALLCASLFLLSCGAGDSVAPHTSNGRELTACGSLETLLPNTMRFVRSAAFIPAAQVIQSELVQTGQLRSALGGVFRVLRAAPPPPGVLGPVEKLPDDPNVDPLLAVVTGAATYVAANHYEVTNVIGRTLTKCDQSGPLLLVEKLMSTRLPLGCQGSEGGCKLAIRALVIPLRDLLANPTLRKVLSYFNVEVSDVPEESFVTLVKIFTKLFAEQVFDFAKVRAIAQLYLYPLIDDIALRISVDQTLSVLEQLTSPQLGVQAALSSSIVCFEAQDPTSAVYRMVYTLLSDPSFKTSELLSAVDATTDLDPEGTFTGWLARVVHVLREEPGTNDALLGVARVLLEERNMKRVLPTMLQMGDQGIVDDLRGLLNRGACR